MFNKEQILHAISTHMADFSQKNASVKPIATGLFNTSYSINSESHSLVIRIAPDNDTPQLFYEKKMMRQEKGIHDILQAQTMIPVPHIYVYDESQTLLSRSFLIMDRIEGIPLSDTIQINHSHVLRQVGTYLAQAHARVKDLYGYIGEHHPMSPQLNWQDAFLMMWEKLILDISTTQIYDQVVCKKLVSLLEDKKSLFDRNVESSLLHMDVWSQNIMVTPDSTVTGLIDWDRALWGDPEIEFAVLDYCGISEPPFWEGYGKERDTSEEAQIRKIFYMLYEIQKYIVIEAGRKNNVQAATNYAKQSISMAEEYLGLKL